MNESCSLHVHVGCQRPGGFTPRDLANIVKAFVHFEPAMNLLTSESRRQNKYAKSNMEAMSRVRGSRVSGDRVDFGDDAAAARERLRLSQRLFSELDRRVGDADKDTAAARHDVVALANGGMSSKPYTRHRYRKLNLQNVARTGTVEFRQGDATVDGEQAALWVLLLVRHVHAALGGAPRLAAPSTPRENLSHLFRDGLGARPDDALVRFWAQHAERNALRDRSALPTVLHWPGRERILGKDKAKAKGRGDGKGKTLFSFAHTAPRTTMRKLASRKPRRRTPSS